MSEKNVEIVRRMFDHANRRDVDGVVALTAAEIECHPAEDQPESKPFRGREALAKYLVGWLDSFDEYAIEPIEYVELGEYVVAVGRITARGSGSGAEISDEDTWLYRFRDGQVIEYYECRTKERALELAGVRKAPGGR